ncbi:MAG: Hsp20/alpha crystallin family protein [Cyclobacteriaceae bacterium]|nr:Hsp20/alpha crystallin family protein [Cyclobacteriaceae bacterium]
MKLMKKSNFPSLFNERWMTDFFDTDRFFFDSDLLKANTVPMLPPVNISELEKEFVVEMAAPGMDKKDFVVTLENGILNISAEHKIENEEKEKDFTRREFNYQSFARSFTLPENVSDDKIVATYENGILKLQLGKKVLTKVPPRKEIAVH